MKYTLIALTLFSAPLFAQQAPMQQMQQMPDLDAMFFEQFDTDKDGRVSRAEFLKPTEAQFDHMDRNKDGMLDQDEVKAFNAEMNQRMEEMQRQMMQQQGQPRRR